MEMGRVFGATMLGGMAWLASPALAQNNYAQPTPEFCQMPGSAYNPLCARPQSGPARADERPFVDFQPIGPLGPVEKASLPRDADSVIAAVPVRLQTNEGPPMWVRVCRTNSAPRAPQGVGQTAGPVGSGTDYMWLRADGDVVRLTHPRCVYMAFQTRVAIGTVGIDEATVEYQFLGRR